MTGNAAERGEALRALIGNRELQARLAADVRAGRLSHAYILEGAHGRGKKTLAMALAAALACTNRRGGGPLPCGTCPACRKISEGKSPDVLRITRGEKASIGVDDVRFLRSDVLISPNDTDQKIYIIEDADTMTAAAQNALLLTLEEPPSYVLFLLLCEHADRLLETIRSRAPTLRLCPVPDEVIHRELSATLPAYRTMPPAGQREILVMAQGSVGRVKELLGEQERKPLMARRALAETLVRGRVGRAGNEEKLRWIQTAGTRREDIDRVLTEATGAVRDLILLKRVENAPLCFFADRDAALELAGTCSVRRLLELEQEIGQAQARLRGNGNVRLVLTCLQFSGGNGSGQPSPAR